MSAVIRTLARIAPPLAGRGASGFAALSVPAGTAAAGRAFISEPGGPVTGVVAPAAVVGSPLKAATDGGLEDDVATPAPGEIWLVALSSVVVAPPPESRISLSSATTCLALP